MALQNQTALVTGASGAIGSAIAATLARAGARVALIGRQRETLERVRSELGVGAERSMAVPCDVTDRTRVEATVAAVLAEMGSIDILVSSAGINVGQRSFRALDPVDWDRIIATNLTGTYNLIHFVLPSMRSRGAGLVVQIASLSGMRASTLAGVAYSASKFGQGALGVCLGREERGRGIRSSVIYPGEVNSSFLDTRASRPGAAEDGRRKTILQPDDVAAAVLFLAELPPRAHVPELVIKPTIDDFC